MNRLIITHANCVDGCCSCAILKEKYKEEAKYIEVDYADADPAYPERYNKFMSEVEHIHNGEVIMADICLKKEIVDMFISKNLQKDNFRMFLDGYLKSFCCCICSKPCAS